MASRGMEQGAGRVCVLTSAHMALDARIYHKECRSLRDAGYQVTLIARESGADALEDIDFVPFPVSSGRLGRFLATFRILRLAVRARADLYHLHDPDLLWVGTGLRLLRGRPVIYDVHEFYTELVSVRTWIPRALKPLLRQLVDGWERFFSRWMSAFIIVVESQRERFSRFGVPVVVVHNFPSRSIVPTVLLSGSPDTEKRRVLYIGDVTTARGVWVLLEAFRRAAMQLPDIDLCLIGRANDDDVRQRLDEWIGDYGLAGRVKIVGFVPHDQLRTYLEQASVGVVPYQDLSQYRWALPTKLFEYMAYALPSVVSDLPGVHDIVVQSQCGLLVEAGNPDALAQGLVTLFSEPELARRMGEAGREAVVERYNWESEKVKLLSLYNLLLARE